MVQCPALLAQGVRRGDLLDRPDLHVGEAVAHRTRVILLSRVTGALADDPKKERGLCRSRAGSNGSGYVPAGTAPKENAVKYLCNLYYNTKKFDALTKDALQAVVAECQPHDAALKKTGQVSAIGRLAHRTAVTVRAQGGRTTTTEGSSLGGDDQIGAFLIVEARDLNEAVRIASLHPAANIGEELGWAVEVRPIQAFEQPS
jgi:hypothetical protein